MKSIGLIGGMSWESTVEYYRLINQETKTRLGGLHSARILMESLDFAEIAEMQYAGRWDEMGKILAGSARRLEGAGADLVLICTNTMHKLADQVQAAVSIPLLHIVDPVATAMKAAGMKRVGLLGTNFTMSDSFFRDRLAERFGLEAVVPGDADKQVVHRVIYEELCLGQTEERSRAAYRSIMERLVANGAEGIILGCTEIGLLVGPGDASVPLFDTTVLHARAAVDMALQG